MERASKIFDDDDERRRRERRHRDRERQKDGKSRSSRKDRRLDIIDKLDVTSIYGTGSEYRAQHHSALCYRALIPFFFSVPP